MPRFFFLAYAAFGAITVTAHPSLAAERAASVAQIKSLIVGHDVNIGAAVAHYGADGRYTYNGQFPGKYRVTKGTICVLFDAGDQRCDQIFVEGRNYTLVNANGQRFPFGQ